MRLVPVCMECSIACNKASIGIFPEACTSLRPVHDSTTCGAPITFGFPWQRDGVKDGGWKWGEDRMKMEMEMGTGTKTSPCFHFPGVKDGKL